MEERKEDERKMFRRMRSRKWRKGRADGMKAELVVEMGVSGRRRTGEIKDVDGDAAKGEDVDVFVASLDENGEFCADWSDDSKRDGSLTFSSDDLDEDISPTFL